MSLTVAQQVRHFLQSGSMRGKGLHIARGNPSLMPLVLPRACARGVCVCVQYLDAFSKLAKQNNSMLIPANLSDPASMIAQVRGRRARGRAVLGVHSE